MSPTGVHPPGFTRGSVRRTLRWGPKVNEYRLLVLSIETVHCQDHSRLQKLPPRRRPGRTVRLAQARSLDLAAAPISFCI